MPWSRCAGGGHQCALGYGQQLDPSPQLGALIKPLSCPHLPSVHLVEACVLAHPGQLSPPCSSQVHLPSMLQPPKLHSRRVQRLQHRLGSSPSGGRGAPLTRACSSTQMSLAPCSALTWAARAAQFKHARGQVVNLLRGAVEPSLDLAIRQQAAIMFKQLCANEWHPDGAPGPGTRATPAGSRAHSGLGRECSSQESITACQPWGLAACIRLDCKQHCCQAAEAPIVAVLTWQSWARPGPPQQARQQSARPRWRTPGGQGCKRWSLWLDATRTSAEGDGHLPPLILTPVPEASSWSPDSVVLMWRARAQRGTASCTRRTRRPCATTCCPASSGPRPAPERPFPHPSLRLCMCCCVCGG